MTDKTDHAHCIEQLAGCIHEMVQTFWAKEGDLWALDQGCRELLIYELENVDELEENPSPAELERIRAALDDGMRPSVHAQRDADLQEAVVEVTDLVDDMAKEHGQQWPSVRHNRSMLSQALDRVDRLEEVLEDAAKHVAQ